MNNKLIFTTVSLAIAASIILIFSTNDENISNTVKSSPQNQNPNKTKQSSAFALTQASKKLPGKEPTAEQLRAKAVVTQAEPELSPDATKARKKLKNALHELLHCHETNTCPVDNSDPRASELLLGQKITAKLDEYTKLSRENDYFDKDTAQLVQEFIDNQDGYVQESAINLMSAMPPNQENALALLDALETSYDAKIMNQAMKELQRYPTLSNQVDKLYQQSLQTGSFYVAQEIALNILPQLNSHNIAQYEEIAKNLPQNSKRADALWSSIKEFKLRQKGG